MVQLTNPARTVTVHGPFDRHNFGDLVFPLVTQCAGSRRVDNVAFTTTACKRTNDNAGFGGVPTISFWDCAREGITEPLFLVHPGGEVLTAKRTGVGANLLEKGTAELVASRLGTRCLRLGYRPFLRNAPEAPYVVDAQSLPIGSRTVFSAVGGVGKGVDDSYNPRVQNALRNAMLVSVRDGITHERVQKLRPDVSLVPDNAASFLRQYATQVHESHERLLARHNLLHSDYAVFHLNSSLLRGPYGKSLVRSALRTLSEQRLNVMVVAMSKAPFHDDEAALRSIAKCADSAAYYGEGNIYEIAALIANASLWLGSSLHGRIMAMAGGVPRVSVALHDLKVSSYAKTWDIPSQPSLSTAVDLEPRLIEAAVATALSEDATALHQLGTSLDQRVGAWFDELFHSFAGWAEQSSPLGDQCSLTDSIGRVTKYPSWYQFGWRSAGRIANKVPQWR